MNYSRKLKPDREITGLLPAIFSLLIFALAALFFDIATGMKVLGIVVLIYSIFGFIAFYRTRCPSYLISFLYMLSFSIYLFFIKTAEYGPRMLLQTSASKIAMVFVFFFLLWLIFLLLNRKIKWRGREIMEMAARDIEPSDDSYTERPMPIGKADYSEALINEFAMFLSKNLIAMAFREESKIFLLPVKMGFEYGILYNPNLTYIEKTWVSFDVAGNVSVHISRKDYLDFKENLSFDKLCESLGNIFIEFFELFKKGEQIRIIDRMNDLKIGFFS